MFPNGVVMEKKRGVSGCLWIIGSGFVIGISQFLAEKFIYFVLAGSLSSSIIYWISCIGRGAIMGFGMLFILKQLGFTKG